MSPALLELDGLSVEYRRRRRVLRAVDDVSFDVRAGETVGLVGESGSGKSTIARAVLGLVPVSGGTIRFDGREIVGLPFSERRALHRDLQIVFQDPYGSLNPMRTVGQTLAEPLEAAGVRDRERIRHRVSEMLERVELPQASAARLPREFSGGQRQRIAIARALMLEPKLVICDEAVSALDLSVQAQILNLLADLQEQTAVSYLFISHDLDVVRHLCDRLVVLYRGRVLERGVAGDVIATPGQPYTQALLDAAPVLDPRVQRARRGTAAVATRERAPEASEGCPFAARCPYVRPLCRETVPELRATATGALAACHRYPEWRVERDLEPRRPAKVGRT
jgi:peptide/nickel transport system ATP-binding protein